MKKLTVNRDIYSDTTIEKTMAVYKPLAVMTAKKRANYTTITFWKCRYDEEQTIKEFENYMIGVENS